MYFHSWAKIITFSSCIVKESQWNSSAMKTQITFCMWMMTHLIYASQITKTPMERKIFSSECHTYRENISSTLQWPNCPYSSYNNLTGKKKGWDKLISILPYFSLFFFSFFGGRGYNFLNNPSAWGYYISVLTIGRENGKVWKIY